jgi:5'-nucleotidase
LRILFTNDDGIESPGLRALVDGFRDSGHELLVVAPHLEQSGASAAIGDFHTGKEIRYSEPGVPGLEGVRCIALHGPPALCVWSACLAAFGPEPDLIVSGINAGANCGRSVLHSGTVGAALTGANFGKPGLAVSIAHSRRDLHWETAATLARPAAEWLARASAVSVLNLNVPNRSISELEGVVSAPLSSIGTVHSTLIDEGAGRVAVHQKRAAPEAGSDSAVVLEGKAALTLLTPTGGEHAGDASRAVGTAWKRVLAPG